LLRCVKTIHLITEARLSIVFGYDEKHKLFIYLFIILFKLGLVCFRLKGEPGRGLQEINALNKKLLTDITASGKLLMVPCELMGKYTIRFCVNAENASDQDIGTVFATTTKAENN